MKSFQGKLLKNVNNLLKYSGFYLILIGWNLSEIRIHNIAATPQFYNAYFVRVWMKPAPWHYKPGGLVSWNW